jgi:hypothetical protein
MASTSTTTISTAPEFYSRPKGVKIAFALLGLSHLIPEFINVPVFPQLLISSSACVYIGCQFASKVKKSSSGEIEKTAKHASEETVTK